VRKYELLKPIVLFSILRHILWLLRDFDENRFRALILVTRGLKDKCFSSLKVSK